VAQAEQAGEQTRQSSRVPIGNLLRPPGRQNAVTVRAILLGLLLCVVAAICFPYTDNVVRGSTLAEDHTAVGVTALFFVLVFAANGLARLIERRFPRHPLGLGVLLAVAVGAGLLVCDWFVRTRLPISYASTTLIRIILAFAVFLWLIYFLLVLSRLVEVIWAGGRWLSLNRAELLTVFAMLLVCSALVTMGLAMQLTPTLPAVTYYGNPQNRWPEVIVPHIPSWAIVTDKEAVYGFFEGIRRISGFKEPQHDRFAIPLLQSLYESWTYLRQIPWRAWLKPLGAWSIFLIPLYAFMICSMVIIRKQWMDREILVYPMMRLPSEMSRLEDESGRVLGPLLRHPGMWIGFLLPVVISSLKAIENYWPAFPSIPFRWDTRVLSDQVTLYIWPSFVAIGFTYLINTRIAFSVWSLSFVGLFISGYIALLGLKSPEFLGQYYGSAGKPEMYHMGMGALLTMAVLGLWTARRHLADVLRKAFLNDRSVDDSKEILSYRAAVLICIVSAAVMLGWLIAIGMHWWLAVIFWLIAMLIFYAMSRIVMEAGLSACVAPGIAPVFVGSKLGAQLIGERGFVALGLQYPWCADIRTFVMASAAHGLKLTHEIEGRRRRLFPALLLAVLVSAAISIGTVIYISYVYQGTSLEPWYYRDAPTVGVRYAMYMINHKPEANMQGWVYTIVGIVLMALLMTAQKRFLRWPVHPLGLAVMGIWLMERLWFSVFVAWLIKTLVLKYGGPRLYMRTIPFFLGMILGQCVIAGVWCLVDWVTGVTGNQVFWI